MWSRYSSWEKNRLCYNGTILQKLTSFRTLDVISELTNSITSVKRTFNKTHFISYEMGGVFPLNQGYMTLDEHRHDFTLAKHNTIIFSTIKQCTSSWQKCTFLITVPLWGESIGKWLLDSPNKGPVMQNFDVFFVMSLNTLLKQHKFGPHWFR